MLRAGIASVLLLVIAATVIALGQRWQSAVDLSASRRHSLSEQSIAAAKAQTHPVELIAVMGPGSAQRDAVAALVSRYQKHNSQLSLEYVNLETQPARVRELQAAPGGELILRTADGSNTREARLQNLTERNLTAALTQLTRSGNRQVAFITGHGERSATASGNGDFLEMAKRLSRVGLESNELSLVTQPVIPETVDLLVIAAPQQRYFPGEVASLLQYVNDGGNLLWLIDDVTDTGLKALQAELGIDTLAGVLLDATSAAYGAESPTFAVIDHQLLPQHPVNDGLVNPLLLPGATALNVTPLAGQSLQPLLLSSDNSWTEHGPVEGAVTFDDDGLEQRGPLLLGATIVRETRHGENSELRREQRIAIIGDADLFASQWVGNGANLEYAERLFNWLAQDDAQLAFATRIPDDAFLDPSSRNILIMGGGFLIGLPMLFLVLAGCTWRRQRHG